jgi:hypothetical protein
MLVGTQFMGLDLKLFWTFIVNSVTVASTTKNPFSEYSHE